MKCWLAMTVKNGFAGCAATLLTLGILAGCQPTTFLTKEVYDGAHAGLPANLEKNHCPITQPINAPTPAPATVNTPDRLPRYLNLQEAIAIALENGNVSAGSLTGGGGGGIANTTLASAPSPGSLNSQSERIRILALNPAIYNAALEAAISRFDVQAISAMVWGNTDNLAQGLSSFQNGQTASLVTGLYKPLATGGIANISMVTTYQNLTTPPTGAFSTLNPLYQARLVFGLEQPLLKDWGVDINQLLSRFPTPSGNGLNPSTASAISGAFSARQGQLGSFVNQNSEGILIARLRFDQQRAEFERNVNILVVNTEVAYWNLYNKYGQLYSIEENLRIMHKVWQQNFQRFKVGKLSPELYYQILGQYEEFRGERIRSLHEALSAERELRGILGLPVEDGTRLVPITPPTMAELRPDWDTALHDALNLRPELILARDNVRYHQYLLSIQNNSLKPDLRAFARFEPVGFGSTLTGNENFIDGTNTPRPTNALRSLAGGHYADYSIGLSLNVPLGYRFEHASMRAARLELTQSYFFLRDQEDKAARYLAEQYEALAHWYKRIEAHRSERLAYLANIKVRLQKIATGISIFGGDDKEGPFAFLDSQRRYSAALVKEYDAIAQYNATLARLEWGKGSILQHNNVRISEGALPQCAQVRAVEYEKERTRSLVLRERPDSLHQPGRLCVTNGALPFNVDEPTPTVDAPLAEKTGSEKVPMVFRRAEEKGTPLGQQEKRTDIKPASLPVPPPAALPGAFHPPLPQLEQAPGTLSMPMRELEQAAPVRTLMPDDAPLVRIPIPQTELAPAPRVAPPIERSPAFERMPQKEQSLAPNRIPTRPIEQGPGASFVTEEASKTLASLEKREPRWAVLPPTYAPVGRPAFGGAQGMDSR